MPWATTALCGQRRVQNYGWLVPLARGRRGVFSAGACCRPKKAAGSWTSAAESAGAWAEFVRSLAIARFCRVLGTLLHNGVPMLHALRIAKDATGNRVLSEAVATAAERISSGKSLARPLAESGHFPTDVIEMISVGEEANNLEQVLIQVAEKMERFTQRRMDLAVRLLEPLMLVVMAAIILFVMMALLLPIFNSSSMV